MILLDYLKKRLPYRALGCVCYQSPKWNIVIKRFVCSWLSCIEYSEEISVSWECNAHPRRKQIFHKRISSPYLYK